MRRGEMRLRRERHAVGCRVCTAVVLTRGCTPASDGVERVGEPGLLRFAGIAARVVARGLGKTRGVALTHAIFGLRAERIGVAGDLLVRARRQDRALSTGVTEPGVVAVRDHRSPTAAGAALAALSARTTLACSSALPGRALRTAATVGHANVEKWIGESSDGVPAFALLTGAEEHRTRGEAAGERARPPTLRRVAHLRRDWHLRGVGHRGRTMSQGRPSGPKTEASLCVGVDSAPAERVTGTAARALQRPTRGRAHRARDAPRP